MEMESVKKFPEVKAGNTGIRLLAGTLSPTSRSVNVGNAPGHKQKKVFQRDGLGFGFFCSRHHGYVAHSDNREPFFFFSRLFTERRFTNRVRKLSGVKVKTGFLLREAVLDKSGSILGTVGGRLTHSYDVINNLPPPPPSHVREVMSIFVCGECKHGTCGQQTTRLGPVVPQL